MSFDKRNGKVTFTEDDGSAMVHGRNLGKVLFDFLQDGEAMGIKTLVDEGSDGPYISVNVEDVVEAISRIPGVSVSYDKPIEVPQELGSVVVSNGATNVYVRFRRGVIADTWIASNSGSWYTDKHIQNVLSNGGKVR